MSETDYQQQCDLAANQLASGDLETAIQTAHKACTDVPEQGRAYGIIASVLAAKKDWLSALETYELSWLLDPQDANASSGVLTVLRQLRSVPDVADLPNLTDVVRPLPELSAFGYYSKACRRFLRIKLLDAAARAGALAEGESSDVLVKTAMMNIDATLCQWSRFADSVEYFSDYVYSQKFVPPTSPLLSLCLVDNPALHLGAAQKFLNDHAGHQAVITRKLRPLGKLARRPRIGYLSADFHDHATSRLMVGMLEAHDRSTWDVVGLSYGNDDASAMRRRVEGAFETFIDLRGNKVEANMAQLRALDLDILVDAKGLTSEFEPAYTLARPAPVVVNFLAYPGSMGSTAYDYIIGDRTVTPFEHQPYFSECIVQMPHSYQCNDSSRNLPDESAESENPSLTRAQAGLPTDAFVLAAFNQTKKITPDQFQLWMRILRALPEAVLWLYCPNETAKNNLRTSVQQAGIAPERLVFAPALPQSQHLARHRLADLFLDTFPYNAHTTASDALWMGLPVVTLQGQAFASRVAASLLTVLGLPQLITTSLQAYEECVVQLARQPEQIQAYKTHLAEQRTVSPLFDDRAYAQNIEQAYAFMLERSRKGKPAHAFEVRHVADGGGARLAGGAAFKPVQRYSRK